MGNQKLFIENKEKLKTLRKNFKCYGCNGPLKGNIESRTMLFCENKYCPVRVIHISLKS